MHLTESFIISPLAGQVCHSGELIFQLAKAFVRLLREIGDNPEEWCFEIRKLAKTSDAEHWVITARPLAGEPAKYQNEHS